MIDEGALTLLFDDEIYLIDASSNKNTITTLKNSSGGKFLGVITKYKTEKEIPLDQKNYLTKIIEQGIKINLTDVEFFTIDDQFSKQLQDHPIQNFIVFGCNSFELGFTDKNLKQYDLIEIENKKIIIADNLKEIESNTAKRTALWLGIKRMLGTT